MTSTTKISKYEVEKFAENNYIPFQLGILFSCKQHTFPEFQQTNLKPCYWFGPEEYERQTGIKNLHLKNLNKNPKDKKEYIVYLEGSKT